MAAFIVLGVLGVIIGVTAYIYRNHDGQLPTDRTSL